MPTPRSYEASHPWITFNTEKYINKLDIMTWARLGESYSKCQHLVGVPLMPTVADKLGEIYLRRGALASAAISYIEAKVGKLPAHGPLPIAFERLRFETKTLFVEGRASTIGAGSARGRRNEASPARRSPRDAPPISSARAA